MTTLPRAAELYLDELARLLAPAEPVDRIEIVAGIREHIEAQLVGAPGQPSDADVSAILRGLGSPDAVARQAFPDSAMPAQAPAQTPIVIMAPTLPVLERRWVASVVVTLLGLILALTSALPLVRFAALATTADALSIVSMPPSELISILIGTWWAWIPAFVLLWATPRWTVLPKVVGTTVITWPLLLASAGAATPSPMAGILVGLTLGLAAATAALVMLSRTFKRAATPLHPLPSTGRTR